MPLGRYASNLTEAHLMNTSTVANQGVPTKLGEYVVQAGEVIQLGYSNGGQDSALGRIFMDLQDGTGSVDGIIRLQVASAQDIPLAVVFESRTEILRSGATDITKRLPFNEKSVNALITEDKKIQLIFIPDATKTVTKADSTIVMSISRTLI